MSYLEKRIPLNRTIRMIKATTLAVAVIVSMSVAPWASAQTAQPASGVQEQSALAARVQALLATAPPVEIKARIADIDRASRIITLHGPKGHDIDVAIGPQVENFNQLRVGDHVEVLYKNALLVSADKVADADKGIRKRVDSSVYQSTPSGYGAARQIEVQATVLDMNASKREVRLRGAYQAVTLVVGPDIDFKTLKVGDTVHAVFVSAYATRVTPISAH
ncbi:hypothetical protein [Paraburkholderia caribensis]|uniref:hypothetical protein n=1 Tax=Paraburkholderia caribensis TaxID=75105 RepID=UPI001F34224F|nr:hypothetical protein [Paraburkholderia caribensis]